MAVNIKLTHATGTWNEDSFHQPYTSQRSLAPPLGVSRQRPRRRWHGEAPRTPVFAKTIIQRHGHQ